MSDDSDVDVKEVIGVLCYYAWPEVSRGPADDAWINTMKKAQTILGWPTCHICDGAGTVAGLECCHSCFGTGLVNPEDI